MRAESLYIDDDYQTEELFPYPNNLPAPQPPGVAKTDIYHDPLVFADIDQIAISVIFHYPLNFRTINQRPCYLSEEVKLNNHSTEGLNNGIAGRRAKAIKGFLLKMVEF
jgi:hypothetical protein